MQILEVAFLVFVVIWGWMMWAAKWPQICWALNNDPVKIAGFVLFCGFRIGIAVLVIAVIIGVVVQ